MQERNSGLAAQKNRIETQKIDDLLASPVIEWEVQGIETIEIVEAEEVFDIYDHLIVEEPGKQTIEYIDEGLQIMILFFQAVCQMIFQVVLLFVKALLCGVASVIYMLVELVSQLSMPSVSHSQNPVRRKKRKSVNIVNNISVSSKADVTIKNNIYVK